MAHPEFTQSLEGRRLRRVGRSFDTNRPRSHCCMVAAWPERASFKRHASLGTIPHRSCSRITQRHTKSCRHLTDSIILIP